MLVTVTEHASVLSVYLLLRLARRPAPVRLLLNFGPSGMQVFNIFRKASRHAPIKLRPAVRLPLQPVRSGSNSSERAVVATPTCLLRTWRMAPALAGRPHIHDHIRTTLVQCVIALEASRKRSSASWLGGQSLGCIYLWLSTNDRYRSISCSL